MSWALEVQELSDITYVLYGITEQRLRFFKFFLPNVGRNGQSHFLLKDAA